MYLEHGAFGHFPHASEDHTKTGDYAEFMSCGSQTSRAGVSAEPFVFGQTLHRCALLQDMLRIAFVRHGKDACLAFAFAFAFAFGGFVHLCPAPCFTLAPVGFPCFSHLF